MLHAGVRHDGKMDMDEIIIACAVICGAAALACLSGHSQAVRRVGCMELVLLAAVCGCAVFGYLKAADFTSGQYHQMLAIALESTAFYLADLEDELEIYGGSDESFFQEAEQVVKDALPVLQSGKARYTFSDVFLVKRNESGAYEERFSTGGDFGWDSLETVVTPLIGRARRIRETVWQEYGEEMTVFVTLDQSRTAPAYALVVSVSRRPLLEALGMLKSQYFFYSLLFLLAATFLVILVVLIQERELHRVLRLLSRVAQGREEVSSLRKLAEKPLSRRESNETHALHSSLWQMAAHIERMDYSKYQVLQAYYRFAPREIERVLGKQSILDVKPPDQVETESTVALVSFAGGKDFSGGEYSGRLNRYYALLCEGRREFGGSIVSYGSDPGIVLLLFYEESRRALRFGIRVTAREMADQAFVFLHRASLVYGVAGDEEQAFPYIYSEEIRTLQKYMDRLHEMGVRMVVTDCVWEMEKEEAVSRYIGYIEDREHIFHLYEILDACPAEERCRRMEYRPKFRQALDLFYKSDFYLARNMFSDILKSCPADEVAKWYVFLCEGGLNSGETGRHSFALLSDQS